MDKSSVNYHYKYAVMVKNSFSILHDYTKSIKRVNNYMQHNDPHPLYGDLQICRVRVFDNGTRNYDRLINGKWVKEHEALHD